MVAGVLVVADDDVSQVSWVEPDAVREGLQDLRQQLLGMDAVQCARGSGRSR